MKTYSIVKTINGQREGETIAMCYGIEDARKTLAAELSYRSGDDYSFFFDAEEAEAEIAIISSEEECGWEQARKDAYIAALRQGIESGAPFIANSVDGDFVTTAGDCYYYDNYRVEIVEEVD